MQLTRLCLSSLALGGRYMMPHAAQVRHVAARAALTTEEGKAFHAIGFNIGSQLGDLKGFTEENVDDVLTGIRAALLEQPPEVPLAEYVPKAAEMIKERASAKAAQAEVAASGGPAKVA